MIEPVFGNRDPKLTYQRREGAYGVIPDQSGRRLLILGAPNQALILPGGGVEDHESPEETLQRELLEEFGAKVSIDRKLGRASEFFYSTHRQTAYEHPATFYLCSQLEVVQAPKEDFNTLMLMPIAVAAASLKRPTHRYAVSLWLDQLKA
ncbi:NUDIX hydrolase [Lacticaseibacillus saniviri]